MRAKLCVSAAVAALGLWAGHMDAQNRTWVSGLGDDANPCSRTAPCKTFAGALSKTAAGGEINVLDPAGYGGATITKSITISSESFEAGVQAGSTNGITINSATAVVVLRGLDFDGIANSTTPGLNAINVLSAAAVYVEKCVIHNYSQKGINFLPAGAATLFVKDTIIRNNTNNPNGGGIFVQGHAGALANAFLDNVLLERNFYGLKAQDFAVVQVRDSSAVANVNNGFWAFSNGSAVTLSIENSRAALNGVTGVRAENAASSVRITDVTVTDNTLVGLQAAGGASLLSFGNNRIIGNPTNGAPTGVVLPQ